MLDSAIESQPPSARGVYDKPAGKADDVASTGFAGLLNLESLPELPLQAHLADAANEVADDAAGRADIPPETAQTSLQQGAWLLVQAAGDATRAESVSVGLSPATEDIDSFASNASDTTPLAALNSAAQTVEVAALSGDGQAVTQGIRLADPVSLALMPVTADVEVPDHTARNAAPRGEQPATLAIPAQATQGRVLDLPVDTAPAMVAADTPPVDVDVAALLSDGQVVADDTGEGEGLLKSVSMPAPGANLNAPAVLGATPATAINGSAGVVAQAQSAQSVPVADLAAHTVATIRHQGADQAELRMSLHPAELGALDLQIEQDGKRLELSITVDSDAARRAVNEQMASLRERLGDAGMQLARLDVSVRDQGQRQNADTPAPSANSDHGEGVKNSPQIAIALPADGLDLYA